MAYTLVMAYDGGSFHGFQRQPAAPTVQGVLEHALCSLTGIRAPVVGASRTDAGVHAEGQVALWAPAGCTIPPERLKDALNARLSSALRIHAVEAVPEAFSLRRVSAKTYAYRVVPGGTGDPWLAARSWAVDEPLSLRDLDELARLFSGTHDFWAFRGEGSSARTTVRRIVSARWTVEGGAWVFRVTGDGFLYHMVRLMVGAQVADAGGRMPGVVGRGLGRPRELKTGQLAPASGLTLERIDFSRVDSDNETRLRN